MISPFPDGAHVLLADIKYFILPSVICSAWCAGVPALVVAVGWPFCLDLIFSILKKKDREASSHTAKK